MTEETTEASNGLSRRSFITKGAIATGAVVWATPVVDSFVSKAVAGSALVPCRCASAGDVVVELTGAGSNPVQFEAQQGTVCAGVCNGSCAFNQNLAPTTYTWSFTSPSAPATYDPAQTTVSVNGVLLGGTYVMGTALTGANGVLNCPPNTANVSVLTLHFKSAPATGTVNVKFAYDVLCDPTTGQGCTASATGSNN